MNHNNNETAFTSFFIGNTNPPPPPSPLYPNYSHILMHRCKWNDFFPYPQILCFESDWMHFCFCHFQFPTKKKKPVTQFQPLWLAFFLLLFFENCLLIRLSSSLIFYSRQYVDCVEGRTKNLHHISNKMYSCVCVFVHILVPGKINRKDFHCIYRMMTVYVYARYQTLMSIIQRVQQQQKKRKLGSHWIFVSNACACFCFGFVAASKLRN